jgi:hypothetical protein
MSIPWDNYIMRKFGKGIRQNILDAYYPFATAVVMVQLDKREKATEKEIIESLPNKAWTRA